METSKTIDIMAKAVADRFIEYLRDDGFCTFADWKRAMWLDTSDIKEEIYAVLDEIDWAIYDEDTGNVATIYSSKWYSYTEFKRLWMPYVKCYESSLKSL